MWATSARYLATMGERLRSLDWLETDSRSGGWLATGADDGVAGINWVTEENIDILNSDTVRECSLYKSSFNLKGQIKGVNQVRFRPQGNWIATYDSQGNVSLWRNRAKVFALEYSIATNIVVTDLQWSDCGYFLVVCGVDGHVQIFSGLNGQKLYSTQVISPNHPNYKPLFTSCTWNKSSTQIALGTDKGEVFGIDPHEAGHIIFTTVEQEGIAVQNLNFFGPTHDIPMATRYGERIVSTQSLSLYLSNGDVVFFPTLISQYCTCVQTELVRGIARWNTEETVLAVVGYRADLHNSIAARFIDPQGEILITVNDAIPGHIKVSLNSICWAMNNSLVFLSAGDSLYSMRVYDSVPTLKDMCRQLITTKVCKGAQKITPVKLPLPWREIEALNTFSKVLIPASFDNTSFDAVSQLFKPPANKKRLLCTLTSTVLDDGKVVHTLFYEHLGQLFPLLKSERFPGKMMRVHIAIMPAFQPKQKPHALEMNTVLPQDQSWGSVPQSSRSTNSSSADDSKWKRFQQRILRAVNHSSVADSSEGTVGSYILSPSQSGVPLVEIKGNLLTNRFKFKSHHITGDADSFYGSLEICTHYVKCEPRRITATLVNPDQAPLTLISKRPEWNPKYGIFELDFGGRINRDSIKNFQFEHEGSIVFQLGRTADNNFSLDFQEPFSPVAAMSVALSSIL